MRSQINITLFALLLFITTFPACSQGDDAPINDSIIGFVDQNAVEKFKFIRFGLNRFVFPNKESKAFERFYQRFDSLTNYDGKDVVIYHIGGSHLQADIYTNEFRKHIQGFGPGLQGSRGWLFPYSLAGTNNPSHYKVESTGEWKGCFNTIRNDSSLLGLMGLAADTYDSIASLKLYFRKSDQRYFSNLVRIYHNTETSYVVEWKNKNAIINSSVNTNLGYTEFKLKNAIDTIDVRFVKMKDDTSHFRLFGIQLLIDEPGLIYSTIGVNGAGFTAYAKCKLFTKQLAVQKPDMFILSIGTNEANVDEFKPDEFEKKYDYMVQQVLSVNPQTALLFTVPNDAYYFKKYPNKNVALLRDVIFKVAKKYDAAVWDWYTIMGGFNSSMSWYKNELMHKDRIHFTYDGYLIKGDMFYEAFLKYLDEYEFNRLVKATNK